MNRWLLALGLLGAATIPAAAQTQAEKDYANMQGKWVMVGGRLDGKAISKVEADQLELVVVIKGDRMTASIKGKANEGSIALKLDPTKSPKQVDTEDVDGP